MEGRQARSRARPRATGAAQREERENLSGRGQGARVEGGYDGTNLSAKLRRGWIVRGLACCAPGAKPHSWLDLSDAHEFKLCDNRQPNPSFEVAGYKVQLAPFLPVHFYPVPEDSREISEASPFFCSFSSLSQAPM